jgi:hypothetical protein
LDRTKNQRGDGFLVLWSKRQLNRVYHKYVNISLIFNCGVWRDDEIATRRVEFIYGDAWRFGDSSDMNLAMVDERATDVRLAMVDEWATRDWDDGDWIPCPLVKIFSTDMNKSKPIEPPIYNFSFLFFNYLFYSFSVF